MASTTTKPVAARVSNDLAERVRDHAERNDLTVSDVVGQCIRQALDPEEEAIRADAENRLRELRVRRDVLRHDADDPEVLSELATIESQIAAAVRELRS